jgi:hypothetical protein
MFAPTLETQHLSLIALRGGYQKHPLDLASYQINMGQLEQAIESMERGKALLVHGFRASIDQLSAVYPMGPSRARSSTFSPSAQDATSFQHVSPHWTVEERRSRPIASISPTLCQVLSSFLDLTTVFSFRTLGNWNPGTLG